MLFSIIVPVFNRPDELDELLASLSEQTFRDFEVLVIDDGSTPECRPVAEAWGDKLNLRYIYKENSGQGFSRNVGFRGAKGDYFVMFDSDCVVPPGYLETVRTYLETENVDAWGGPDRAHPSFTPVQKAINYAMTSPLTTGGIRGGEKQVGRFHPRSFNMGISRKVFEKTGGYRITRKGEDIDFSIRIIKAGFRTALIPDAFVYHKRRSGFGGFFRQLHFFGRARVHTERLHPEERSLFHALPSLFVLYVVATLTGLLTGSDIGSILLFPLLIYIALLLVDALKSEKQLSVAALGLVAGLIQLSAYGIGYIRELVQPRNQPFEEGKF